jgi:VCBS repeat protein
VPVLRRLAHAAVSVFAVLMVAPSANAAVFGPPDTYPLGAGEARDAVTGDFNRDGDPDIAVVRSWGIDVLVGGPGKTFGSPTAMFDTTSGFLIGSPTSADFNRDGDLDLAVINNAGDQLLVFLGGAGASFAAPASLDLPGLSGHTVAALDADADGDVDLAIGAASGSVGIMQGDGAGHFAAPAVIPLGVGNRALEVGHFNGDDDPDLVVGDANQSKVSLLLGDTGATFKSAGPPVSTGFFEHLAVGDLNADGRSDVALATYLGTQEVFVMHGNAADRLDAPVGFNVGQGTAGVAVADFNGDGAADLAAAVRGLPALATLLPGGAALLGNPISRPLGGVAGPLVADDVDGDGRLDLIAVHETAVSVLRNVATPAIETDPSGLTFPAQAQNTLSAARTITVHSTGERVLRPRRVRLIGLNADDFVVTADTCSSEVIAPGGSCLLRVRFAPAAAGPREANLQIDSDAAGQAIFDVPLSGVGGALPTGATGATGLAGPPGKSGSATVRDRLAAAFATDRMRARGGTRLRARFVSTTAGVATLELRRGTRPVRRVSVAVEPGLNTARLAVPRKRGRYTLALTVTGVGQTVTDAARLTVVRRSA